MERDNLGRPLTKTGHCGTCGRTVRALVDEDFECCEPRHEGPEEVVGAFEPSSQFIMKSNYTEKRFTARDLIIASIGDGWTDFGKLRGNLRDFGYDFSMMVDKDTLIYILEEMEEDDFIEVHWDMETVKRIYKEW